MIYFSFALSNPFSNRFANLYCKSWQVAKHKTVELELLKDTTIIDFMIRITARQSHGGADLGFGLFGYSVSLCYYDNRHWNKEAGRYYIYNDKGEEL